MRYKKILGGCLFLAVIAASCNAIASQNYTVIKILGVNDFHGQITQIDNPERRPQGGAAVLASYLREAARGYENNTIITFSGDQVGASVPSSGLLDHQPSILFFNTLTNHYCSSLDRMAVKCNVVATVGNHEFDNGQAALFNLIYGSDAPPKNHWINLPSYPGAAFPYVSANIVSASTGKLLFPPYVIKSVNGVSVAFIGAILKNAAGSMLPENASTIKVLDEAETINKYIPELKQKGVAAIVVIIHEGGDSKGYDGDTRQDVPVNGSINHIVKELNDGVDVVMAAHTHRFINAYLPNHNGHTVLVTQANSYSSAFAEVTLQVDNASKTVASKSAKIISTYADVLPGSKPDAKAQDIVTLAQESVAPIVNAHVGTLSVNLTRFPNSAGESMLGNLVADAFRNTMHADIGVTNSSSIRTDLHVGEVTWGDLYAVQPFGNPVVKMTFMGQDILDLLEQQWKTEYKMILQISGLEYFYDESQPVDYRVYDVRVNGKPIDPAESYTVAVSSFLASGGSGFTVMKRGKIIEKGTTDLETVTAYIKSLPQPFSAKIEGRIQVKARH